MRNALIDHHWGLVWNAVYEFDRRFNRSGRYSIDELVSEASVIAIRCVELFDYRRGFQFSTYFHNSFIRTAIRTLLHEGAKKGMPAKKRPSLMGDAIDDLCRSEAADPFGAIERKTGMTVDELFESLNDQQKAVLKSRFMDGKTLQVIADESGLSKERIRQVETRALKEIRKLLGLDSTGGER